MMDPTALRTYLPISTSRRLCTWPPGDTERCGGSTVSSVICG